MISTVIGTMMALALVRHQFFGRRAANFLIVIPMATPEIVMGASLLSFFLILGSPSLGFETLLIAHVMFCISFVVVVVRSRLIGFDRNLEEAAKDLGATPLQTFRLVTLPLIMPGIFAGAMLAFALSIDDFVISNFNSGTTVTFPLYIFGAAQRGIPVEVNCIAMMLFGLTVVAMVFTTCSSAGPKRWPKSARTRTKRHSRPPAPPPQPRPEPKQAPGGRTPRAADLCFGMRNKGLPRGRVMADLADRQHGVVSTRQLQAKGFSRAAISRAAASGHIFPVHRGVYAVGRSGLSLHGQCLAAVLGCGPDALLSHWSAAWLWGTFKGSPIPLHVTGPIPRELRHPVRIHHSRVLADADRTVEDGIPVTAVPRVLLDLAARDRRGRLRHYMERAEELDLLDLGAIQELLDRTRGHHGWGRLRRAAAFYEPPPFTRSGFERRFLEALSAAGLPRPSVNFNVAGYEVDMYWPEQRFAVELDSYRTHGTQEAFGRDRLRQEDLLLDGVRMTRVTDERFYRDPDAVIERVRRLLAERRPR